MAQMTIIAAITKNGCIGINNDLVIKDKEDMNFFKHMTMYKTIVYGRKTFESFGNKPLPNRKNIIVSSTLENCTKETIGTIVVKDVIEVFNYVADDEEVVFIGGGQLYKDVIGFCNVVYLSEFDNVTANKCDVFFPMKELEEYKLVDVEQRENFKIKKYVR